MPRSRYYHCHWTLLWLIVNWTLRIKPQRNQINIQKFSFKKMLLKILCVKWWSFCSGFRRVKMTLKNRIEISHAFEKRLPNATHKFFGWPRAPLQMVQKATSELLKICSDGGYNLQNHHPHLKLVILSQVLHFERRTTLDWNKRPSHLPLVVRWATQDFALSKALDKCYLNLVIPPETKFRGGILDSPCLSVRPSVRPSVRGSVSGW